VSLGSWIRGKLVLAGDKGVVVADLHNERWKQGRGWIDEETLYKGGTYHSFARFFSWFKQLEFVEPTGKKEASELKGDGMPLKADRCYYKITDKGLSAPIEDWHDPVRALHPEWTPLERKARYYRTAGKKKRGRPRRTYGKKSQQ